MSVENMTAEERDAQALRRLFQHPELGLKAKALYKQIDPNFKSTDLDVEERVNARTADLQKSIDKLQEDAQLSEITRRREKNHEDMRKAGFDPVAVEKVMTEEKIGSYDTAMKYITAQNKSAAPTPSNITPITMPEDAKEISKNPAAWARKKASEAINDLINKRNSI